MPRQPITVQDLFPFGNHHIFLHSRYAFHLVVKQKGRELSKLCTIFAVDEMHLPLPWHDSFFKPDLSSSSVVLSLPPLSSSAMPKIQHHQSNAHLQWHGTSCSELLLDLLHRFVLVNASPSLFCFFAFLIEAFSTSLLRSCSWRKNVKWLFADWMSCMVLFARHQPSLRAIAFDLADMLRWEERHQPSSMLHNFAPWKIQYQMHYLTQQLLTTGSTLPKTSNPTSQGCRLLGRSPIILASDNCFRFLWTVS